ncbi:MAG: hypothetical protein H6835_13305 [Planctomycetes bacterium]|nr:hypothetical protein [Planctomycetota bacterium]
MAISGTVPARSQQRVDPIRAARLVRRVTFVVGIAGVAWFFARFTTRWVPNGMDTNPALPPGSWCIVDRWASGLRVGSDVFCETPQGPMLTRVTQLDGDEVFVVHPNPESVWVDSRSFGPIRRSDVQGVVVVGFPIEEARGR